MFGILYTIDGKQELSVAKSGFLWYNHLEDGQGELS